MYTLYEITFVSRQLAIGTLFPRMIIQTYMFWGQTLFRDQDLPQEKPAQTRCHCWVPFGPPGLLFRRVRVKLAE